MSSRFRSPTLDCDIVMKGGITSGVVYPPAVTRLAGTYRFHNVGGTSAGAIAAAMTAAAEVGRYRTVADGEAGFERLDSLSGFLAGGGNLMALFQPQKTTKPLFGLLKAGLDSGPASVVARLPLAALQLPFGWLLTALGMLPGVALGALWVVGRAWSDTWPSLLGGLGLVVLFGVAAMLVAAAFRSNRVLAAAFAVVGAALLALGTGMIEARRISWSLATAWLLAIAGAWFGAMGALALHAIRVLPSNGFGLTSGGVSGGSARLAPSRGAERSAPGPENPLSMWLADELDLTADVVGSGRILWRSDLELLELLELPAEAVPDPDRPFSIKEAAGADIGLAPGVNPTSEHALRMDALAGTWDPQQLPRRPLTFGDLQAEGVTLRMLTTNLSHGRPYRLPLETGTSFNSSGYFFDPAAWRRYFPEYVVKWMEDNPPARWPGTSDRDWRDWRLLCRVLEPLRPIPSADQLPVAVATRMSLSFPVLISAVPLHAVDWSLEANTEARKAWRVWADAADDWSERLDACLKELRNNDVEDVKAKLRATVCWFSDGGISSNFPIHFFDAPLPRWPTFGLNLRDPHPDHPIVEDPPPADEGVNVWLPDGSSAGHHLQWNQIDGLFRFLRVMADTLQNWSDNAQMRVHGFWDRVAHINLGPQDGGMNLNMDGDLIARLGNRGEAAAKKLAERFAITGAEPSDAEGWDYHRWLRYRSSMQLLEGLLAEVRRGYRAVPIGGARTYAELIDRRSNVEPTSYRFSQDQREFAQAGTRTVVELSESWEADPDSFADGAPRPSPELRITPPI